MLQKPINFLVPISNCSTIKFAFINNSTKFANKLTGEAIIKETAMTELSGGQTRSLLIADAVVIGNSPIILLDEIENALVSADVGIATTVKIIERLENRIKSDKYLNISELNTILKKEIQEILITSTVDNSYINYELPSGHKPHIILVVGVNGVGKTTTIGKLANNFSLAGKSVLIHQ